MFFYSNLFLNAFNIKDINSAIEFVKELKNIKKKHVSESLTQSFLIWEALDKHVEAVDIRNILEAFSNILNAFLEGINNFWIEKGKEKERERLLREVEQHLKNTQCLKKYFLLSEGIILSDEMVINEKLSKFKEELLKFVNFIIKIIVEREGLNVLRAIINEKVGRVIKNEWYRLQNLEILKELMVELWL